MYQGRENIFRHMELMNRFDRNRFGDEQAQLNQQDFFMKYYRRHKNTDVTRVADALFEFAPLPKQNRSCALVVSKFINLKGDKTPYIYVMTDRRDDILYVGYSTRIYQRLTDHMAKQPWWEEVTEIYFERFEGKTAKEINELEQIYIKAVNPKYNKQQYSQQTFKGFPQLCQVEDVYKVMEDRMKSPGYKKRMREEYGQEEE